MALLVAAENRYFREGAMSSPARSNGLFVKDEMTW
jgi:hypothetical protein